MVVQTDASALDERINRSLKQTSSAFSHLYQGSAKPTLGGGFDSNSRTNSATNRLLLPRSPVKSEISDVSVIDISQPATHSPTKNKGSIFPPIFEQPLGIDLSKPDNNYLVSPRVTHFNGSMDVNNPPPRNSTMPGDHYPTGFAKGAHPQNAPTASPAAKMSHGIDERLNELKRRMETVSNTIANEVSPRGPNKFSAMEEYKRQQFQLRTESKPVSSGLFGRTAPSAAAASGSNPFSSGGPIYKPLNATYPPPPANNYFTDASNSAKPNASLNPETFRFNPLPDEVQAAYDSQGDQNVAQEGDQPDQQNVPQPGESQQPNNPYSSDNARLEYGQSVQDIINSIRNKASAPVDSEQTTNNPYGAPPILKEYPAVQKPIDLRRPSAQQQQDEMVQPKQEPESVSDYQSVYSQDTLLGNLESDGILYQAPTPPQQPNNNSGGSAGGVKYSDKIMARRMQRAKAKQQPSPPSTSSISYADIALKKANMKKERKQIKSKYDDEDEYPDSLHDESDKPPAMDTSMYNDSPITQKYMQLFNNQQQPTSAGGFNNLSGYESDDRSGFSGQQKSPYKDNYLLGVGESDKHRAIAAEDREKRMDTIEMMRKRHEQERVEIDRMRELCDRRIANVAM